MARKKKPENPPKGSPAWMTTFSDLMNLLLCFFVLLFSMSSVDVEKFTLVIASLQSSFSILPSGGASIEQGSLISAGISQLEDLDIYFQVSDSSQNGINGGNVDNEEDGPDEEPSTEISEVDIEKEYREQALSESERMKEEIEKEVNAYGIQNQVELDFNAEFVSLTLNGAILFDSGKAEIRADAVPLIDNIGKILQIYDSNIIEIEGHTDNVPMKSGRYEDNNVLSMYRALTVANHIRNSTTLNPANIKSSGRGEYVPIADNATEEGRARNRRVEIKVYNSYNSAGAAE